VLYQELGDQGGIASCLAGFAGIAMTAGQSERAARLAGSAEALFTAICMAMNPADQVEYDRNLATIRAQPNEVTFTTAWAAGRALSLEQAIAYALNATSPAPTPSHPP
jgi:hypothetical protein